MSTIRKDQSLQFGEKGRKEESVGVPEGKQREGKKGGGRNMNSLLLARAVDLKQKESPIRQQITQLIALKKKREKPISPTTFKSQDKGIPQKIMILGQCLKLRRRRNYEKACSKAFVTKGGDENGDVYK